MSSRCRLARLLTFLVVDVEMAETDSGQTPFEAAQGFSPGVADGDAVAVVGLSEAIEADLGDSDAVQGGVELAVARTGHAHAAGSVSRPHWNRGHPGVTGESGLAFEPSHSGDFSDEFGRGQLPTARKRKQRRGDVADALSDPLSQGVDRLSKSGDVGQLVTSQLSDQPGPGLQPVPQDAGMLSP